MLGALDVTLFPLRDSSVARYGLSSNKLFDYLASGRPVLACCGVRGNPVEESGGGISVPSSAPEAVANALITLDIWASWPDGPWGARQRWVYAHHGTSVLADRFLAALSRARVSFYNCGAGGLGRGGA